jgi:hypothetical protein
MTVIQIVFTTAGSVAQPIQVPLALYGKYKVSILGFQFGSSHTNQQFVQIRSRQLILPFAGANGTLGADIDQSARFPVFAVSGTNANQGGNSQLAIFHPMILYTDFDGVFEAYLVDMVDQVAARLTNAVLTLNVEPVSTVTEDQHEYASQQLNHTYTQLPMRTYQK